jgi:poly(A) polymerase
MNAVYMAADGTVFDPTGYGVADIENGTVRFIGDPATRLREDPLRLLRFFRFCGLYGLSGFTDELKPILAHALPALGSISHARIQKELAKLALTPHAVSVRAAMEEVGMTVDEPS